MIIEPQTKLSAPGHKFIGCDFSGIEARVTPWCAGQEDVLDIFRRNECVYCVAATGIFNRTITKKDKDERQVGKVAILALGYNGGIAAFFKMCQTYDLSLASVVPVIWPTTTEDEKDKAEFAYSAYVAEKKKLGEEHFNKPEGLVADVIKQRWRRANPKIVKLWADIEQAAIDAVKFADGTGFTTYAGRAMFTVVTGPGGHQWLEMKLPSGRSCYYYSPEVRQQNKFGKMKDVLTFVQEHSTTFQMLRTSTYGGRLVENLVQAISRDLMVESMHAVRKAGYEINLTVHDEIVTRVPKHVKMEEIDNLMLTPISWAEGLPIAVESWEGPRFRK